MTIKRIAIQFFGHLRTFEATVVSLRKMVIAPNAQDGYEFDIFIHTWDELDHTTVNYRNPNGERLLDGDITDAVIAFARELYQPVKMAVESQRNCPEQIFVEKTGAGRFKRSIKGCLNMAYSLYRASELRREYEKESDVQYNWVIVTRPDIIFRRPFHIEDFMRGFEIYKLDEPENGLYHSSNIFGREVGIEDPRFRCGTDLIWFGRPKNVDRSTALFADFETNRPDPDNFYCMEIWWHDFWVRQGLAPMPLNYIHARHDFDVLREIPKLQQQPQLRQSRQGRNWKRTSRSIRKILLSLLPYFLVRREVHRLGELLKNE